MTTKIQQKQVRVVIWDYDWTLINDNSDTWIVKQLSQKEYDRQTQLEGTPEYQGQWTKMMDHTLTRLTSKEGECLGITLEQLATASAAVPHFSETIDAIRRMGEDDEVVQCVISDANQFFIEKFFESKQLTSCFKGGIHTNTSMWDEHNTMRVFPYVSPSTPHGCYTCRNSPNMCKGKIVKKILKTLTAQGLVIRSPIVYLGDGYGDFCGAKTLGEKDVVLARKGYQLLTTIRADGDKFKSRVKVWENGVQQAEHLVNEGVLKPSL